MVQFVILKEFGKASELKTQVYCISKKGDLVNTEDQGLHNFHQQIFHYLQPIPA